MDSYEALHREVLGLVYAIIIGLFGAVAKMIIGDTRRSLIKDLVKEAFMAVFISVVIFFCFYETDKKGILLSAIGIASFMSRQILETINKAGIFISSIRSDFIIKMILKNFFPNVELPDVIPVYEKPDSGQENAMPVIDDQVVYKEKTDKKHEADYVKQPELPKHVEQAESIEQPEPAESTESPGQPDICHELKNSGSGITEKRENSQKLFEIRNKKRYERLKHIKSRIDSKKTSTNTTQEETDVRIK